MLIGGHDVRDIARETLGDTVAMVSQEPFLFTGTVLENVRYRTCASREDVVRACQAVSAHDFIADLPRGYDTMVEQRG